MVNFVPVGHWVVVEPVPVKDKTDSGIILADPNQKGENRLNWGVVASVPEFLYSDSGSEMKVPVSIGDHILFDRYGKLTIEMDGKEVVLLKMDSIYGYEKS